MVRRGTSFLVRGRRPRTGRRRLAPTLGGTLCWRRRRFPRRIGRRTTASRRRPPGILAFSRGRTLLPRRRRRRSCPRGAIHSPVVLGQLLVFAVGGVFGPKGRANAKKHDKEYSQQACSPCPGCRSPLVRMIDKDGNQRIEKVFFDVVQQPFCIVQEVSVLEQRIGASGRGVTRVKALAPWLRRAVYPNGAVITDPPTRTIEGTKKIRARGTQSGTDQGLGKCTC